VGAETVVVSGASEVGTAAHAWARFLDLARIVSGFVNPGTRRPLLAALLFDGQERWGEMVKSGHSRRPE